jgi:hypothetical protein
VTALALPLAHGIVGRTDLPIPAWLFSWAAGAVLVVSFVALGTLWPRPRLQHVEGRPLGRVPVAVDAALGALGVLVFAAVVFAGLRGTLDPDENLAPTTIYVHFWVGFTVVSLLFGNVFAVLSPWRALARFARWLHRDVLHRDPMRTRAWPERLGRWPAVVTILAFAWLELAFANRDDPRVLAWLALGYAAIQLAGMRAFGIERWADRGDGFGTLFGLYGRLAVLARGAARILRVRPPLAGAPPLDPLPGTTALLLVAIGSTTFDGLTNGQVWSQITPSPTTLDSTLGLLASIALVSAIYWLGIKGVQGIDRRHTARDLGGRFAHTLVPIAAAYAVAHYFSLLVYSGQADWALASDPLGHGANLFGTASAKIDYGVIGSAGIWYVQVAALVAGHVGGLILAHDRAVALYREPRLAMRSQYWMLAVMVGFTSLGLWLLSVINT